MRQEIFRKRGWSVCGLIAGCFLQGASPVVMAQSAPTAKPTSAENEILRRLRELEAQVVQYREETARLRAELSQRPEAVSKKPPAAKAAGAGGEWDEPELDRKPEGRDDEARRRLLVVETQLKKSNAEAAKREEEQKDKVSFEFSGKYKAQFNSRNNFNLNNPQQQWTYDNARFVDQRYSLQVDANYEALLTRLVLDKGNFSPDWKEDSEGTYERWGQFQTIDSQLVRELFVQYTGPFMLRIGRQNWDVGQRLVLEGPMDGIRIQYPFGNLPWGQTTLSAGYMAVGGGWSSYDKFNASGGRLGGNRQEMFGVANKLDAYYADLDIRAGKGLRLRPYFIKVADRGGAGDPDLNLDKDFNASTSPRDGHFRPLWTGVSATAELGKWSFDAEAVLLSGDYMADRKLRANAVVLKTMYDFGKIGPLADLSAGLQFGRGSGSGTDDSGTGTMRNFNGLFLCRERNKFGNIFSEDIRAGYALWDSSLSNVTYLRLEAPLRTNQGLKITPSITRLWTTKEVFAGHGPVFDWSQGTATSQATSRDIGWEADLNAAFPIYKSLGGFFSLGYFSPGAVYARPDGSNPRPAWEMVLGAEVKF